MPVSVGSRRGSWGDEPEAHSISIASTDPSTATIFTPRTNGRFAVYSLYAQNTHASSDVTLTFRSDTTDLSGAVVLKALDTSASTDQSSLLVGGGPFPWLVGRKRDEPFKILKTGAGTVEGWAVVGNER